MIFLKEFIPKKIKKFNILESRERFKNKKNKNLRLLMEKRFFWMKKFIKNKKNIIELGSGNGASRDILKNKHIILTDIQKYKWISKKINMNSLKLEKKYIKKVDVFIINHAMHHCANPAKLLKRKYTLSIVGGGIYNNILNQIGKENTYLFKYIFSENGIISYKNNKCISKNNIKNKLNEKTLQDIINYILIYIANDR